MRTEVIDLGRMTYTEAEALQKQLQKKIINGGQTQYLLIVEHPPVITVGNSSGHHAVEENLLVSSDFLNERNIELVVSERGGNITCHEPGQLVVYPILNLNFYEKDVKLYVDYLERSMSQMMEEIYGVKTQQLEGMRGLWVNNNKIMAIGCNVKRWVTKYGLAINVSNDLETFSWINPCGFTDRGVTSLSKELSRNIMVDEVKLKVPKYFNAFFPAEYVWTPLENIEINQEA